MQKDYRFNHNILDKISLKQINTNGKRKYQTATGKSYPSITTVLSHQSNKSPWLQKWKKEQGPENVKKILATSSKRGNIFHGHCENFLLNNPVDLTLGEDHDKYRFLTIKDHLEKSCNNIHGTEFKLYSDILELAGTTDLICEYNGKLSIVDFKTSAKSKKEEWVGNYYSQGFGYAWMFMELYNIPIQQVVILVVTDSFELQVFKKSVKQEMSTQIDLLKKYIQEYHHEVNTHNRTRP